ncbi:hypothetical protein [Clostridium thailandense]|uniref:hypothetical protein n=1 Tax=Clostridium thailandense TaxID=2794346 RepID=UPI00398A3086
MGVAQKYEGEIRYIIDELNCLVNERYYERGTGEAKASTIAKNIKEEFVKLIKKMDSGEPSDWDGIFK